MAPCRNDMFCQLRLKKRGAARHPATPCGAGRRRATPTAPPGAAVRRAYFRNDCIAALISESIERASAAVCCTDMFPSTPCERARRRIAPRCHAAPPGAARRCAAPRGAARRGVVVSEIITLHFISESIDRATVESCSNDVSVDSRLQKIAAPRTATPHRAVPRGARGAARRFRHDCIALLIPESIERASVASCRKDMSLSTPPGAAPRGATQGHAAPCDAHGAAQCCAAPRRAYFQSDDIAVSFWECRALLRRTCRKDVSVSARRQAVPHGAARRRAAPAAPRGAAGAASGRAFFRSDYIAAEHRARSCRTDMYPATPPKKRDAARRRAAWRRAAPSRRGAARRRAAPTAPRGAAGDVPGGAARISEAITLRFSFM